MQDQAFRSTVDLDLISNDASQCLPDAIPQTSTRGGYISSCGDNTHCTNPAASESSTPSGSQNDRVASSSCLCRPNLMLCLPKVVGAVQDKRLDEVFKVTGELIRRCQDVMDCKTNQASCPDLLLVVTALQEIHPCFDYIAKSEMDSAVKVSFGGYEVTLNDTNLRATLVMDLVQRTDTLLTSISSNGQSMINQLSEPSCLASANIAYLEAMISHFKTILRCVTVYMEEAVQDGGLVPETVLNASVATPTSAPT